MNKYKELKDKQQKEIDAFPFGVCFSEKQYEEMMTKWNLSVDDTDKICAVGGGCYIRKTDKDAFLDMLKRFEEEKQAAINEDSTGYGFIYDMFLFELGNHEYCITYDLTETFDALNVTQETIDKDKRFVRGLKKAVKDYLKNF